MTDAPETRYARSADGTHLAYQVSGDGPLDLVFDNASGVPTDLLSEDPWAGSLPAAPQDREVPN
jgi:hypothetical protein